MGAIKEFLEEYKEGLVVYFSILFGIAFLLGTIQLLVLQDQSFQMRKQAALLEAAKSGGIELSITLNEKRGK